VKIWRRSFDVPPPNGESSSSRRSARFLLRRAIAGPAAGQERARRRARELEPLDRDEARPPHGEQVVGSSSEPACRSSTSSRRSSKSSRRTSGSSVSRFAAALLLVLAISGCGSPPRVAHELLGMALRSAGERAARVDAPDGGKPGVLDISRTATSAIGTRRNRLRAVRAVSVRVGLVPRSRSLPGVPRALASRSPTRLARFGEGADVASSSARRSRSRSAARVLRRARLVTTASGLAAVDDRAGKGA